MASLLSSPSQRFKPMANLSTEPRSFQRISLIFILSLFTIVTVATAEREQRPSPVLRLPSQSTGLCAGTPPPSWCPAKCFRTDPVCGADGVTYWCGCAEAACAGVEVARLGFCEVGSAGSVPLPGQALLLVHIVWLILLGFSVLFGLF